ncbi:YraN family protein [Corynebacterium anserum]|uniref:UPF0102 protein GP473_05460 n=1 Tax=Corynebacterium anserum TaxID=2684406 RepID=A0A7G7YNV7_9CORY|nr:YraN family protein [Corynebacterium anserum]MBC2681774.1 YraN family protein [Corynebacterium anserum]QNH96177.1 YraN family protein [Corynebacterium anserum]
MTTKDIGNRGEDVAVSFLRDKGWTILERNWLCPYGELDVVGQTAEGLLVFLEVKFRSSTKFGGGLAAVTPAKLKKMKRASALWMQQNRPRISSTRNEYPCVRFDVIDVGPEGIRHHLEGVL